MGDCIWTGKQLQQKQGSRLSPQSLDSARGDTMMTSRLRLWWKQIIKQQKTKLLLENAKLILITILIYFFLIALISLIIFGYRFDWTGFNGNKQTGKTLWDWLQLLAALAIPIVVGFGAAWFTAQQSKVSAEKNTDNQRESALQAYIDKMSELLLEKHLRDSIEDTEVRKIAQVRTLTVIHSLDGNRKGSVLRFLHESGLIDKDKRIIDLSFADLRNANLSLANLSQTDLRGACLFKAHLSEANLRKANLSETNLDEANVASLSQANLSQANLSEADLSGAKLYDADLNQANLSQATLSGAKLYDADLSQANLSQATLSGATLFRANLSRANLSFANLRKADLSFANLRKADLVEADLSGANLSGANLREATVTREQLEKVKLLGGTIMPDGSKHSW